MSAAYRFEDVQDGLSDLEMRERVIWKRTQPLLVCVCVWGGGGEEKESVCESVCVRMMRGVCICTGHTQN